MVRSLSELRREYSLARLDAADVAPDPFSQFGQWLRQALDANLPDPTSMSLATVSTDGRPSCRIVLLKGYDARGFVFYTNYHSAKGREIEHNRAVALLFHWVELERQVRIEGHAERTSEEESDAYFSSRPLGSRLSAVVSPQSDVVPDRARLEELFAQGQARYGENVPRPPHWGGYRVAPFRFEFWQGRPNRLHDRILYVRTPDAWRIERLAP